MQGGDVGPRSGHHVEHARDTVRRLGVGSLKRDAYAVKPVQSGGRLAKRKTAQGFIVPRLEFGRGELRDIFEVGRDAVFDAMRALPTRCASGERSHGDSGGGAAFGTLLPHQHLKPVFAGAHRRGQPAPSSANDDDAEVCFHGFSGGNTRVVKPHEASRLCIEPNVVEVLLLGICFFIPSASLPPLGRGGRGFRGR